MIITKPAAMPAAALALAITVLATGALADDRVAVEAFYTRILTASDPADPALAAQTVISEDWKIYGDYTGVAGTRDQFVGMMTGFHKLIPDLTWKVEDIVQSGDTFVVRGRASGTPQGRSTSTGCKMAGSWKAITSKTGPGHCVSFRPSDALQGGRTDAPLSGFSLSPFPGFRRGTLFSPTGPLKTRAPWSPRNLTQRLIFRKGQKSRG